MKTLTLLIILAMLIWIAWGTGSLIWTLYLEHQDPGVDVHIPLADVARGIAPSFGLIVALGLAVRLAIKDLRR